MQLDVDALFASASGVVKLVLFFGLFLVVRGTPALLLYRGVLDDRERIKLALFSSTQLPLVLAITTVRLRRATCEPRRRPRSSARRRCRRSLSDPCAAGPAADARERDAGGRGADGGTVTVARRLFRVRIGSGAQHVHGTGDHEDDDGVGDQRLHGHQALGAARQRHRVRRADRDRVRERH